MMALSKRYQASKIEPLLQDTWDKEAIYTYSPEAQGPVFSIDTPPPTVSGHLHLGHVYSYSHADFMARFWRMRGYRVFYPMGFDDNGLPTERLVEKQLGITAEQVGRKAFIEKCLQISEQAEADYRSLWQRLGLSIDWRHTYRTIDKYSQRTSQFSFIDLYHKGRLYRQQAPTIWCPECQTAIAQAELDDKQRQSEFVTLAFELDNGETLPIATTRPELLGACVAIFVHPDDPRFQSLTGKQARVPLFAHQVPILQDAQVDPEKGTGAVMCCTFGDATDVDWWRTHKLPLIEIMQPDGRLSEVAGEYAGKAVSEARRFIKERLESQKLILECYTTNQSVRVHERCDTPIEYIVTRQWFIKVLDEKQRFLEIGDQIHWYPEHMRSRYRAWVENLNWDWCISRQRYFGIPFPVWYCQDCDEVILAEPSQLPVDPNIDTPEHPCPNCGSQRFLAEKDVQDTWATSSLSPQIVAGWLARQKDWENIDFRSFEYAAAEDLPPEKLYQQVFPFSLRPQAHEIIRTWTFYTIVKSYYHFSRLPWESVLISGWGIAAEGMGKISKSRGGGPMPPMEMIERYSADAVRYWAASTATGKDSIINEEKIQMGAKLVTKLWNVARFSERFLPGEMDLESQDSQSSADTFTPADRWILSRTQRLIRRTTQLFEQYEYAAAKSEMETFFWTEFADNYLEMCKQRLYDPKHPQREGARRALRQTLLSLLKLLAPLLPFITDAIFRELFAQQEGVPSIHKSAWPIADPTLENPSAEALGTILVAIASAVRRYKSENNLSLGTELETLQLSVVDARQAQQLRLATADLKSITRASSIEILENLDPGLVKLTADLDIGVGVTPVSGLS
ncbi:MAG: valine--tRNA ligase [Anaerolineales bacterium]